MRDLSFSGLFKTNDPARDNFLARVFGMFSEEPIRIWCRSDEAPYVDLGRPTIKKAGETRGSTLDFALKSKSTSQVYVAELKCELAYANYGHLTLTRASQVARHVKENKDAFVRFIDCAKNPREYLIQVRGEPIEIAGSILVWGSTDEAGRRAVTNEFHFADVLSVENAIRDLLRSGNSEYKRYIEQRRKWCDQLFTELLGC